MTTEKTITDLVHPAADGFREKVTPKEVEADKLFIYACPCGHSHFRHAGYVRVNLPYLEPGEGKRMGCEPYQVMVCTKCKKSSAWINGQMYDMTSRVDLEAWEKLEAVAHKATGPGGEC